MKSLAVILAGCLCCCTAVSCPTHSSAAQYTLCSATESLITSDQENTVWEPLLAVCLEANEKCFSYDPFVESHLTADDYEIILSGTDMEGMGKYIENMEQTYHVNGLFCLGVARAESGLGSSKIAKNRNNFFGIMGKNGAKYFDDAEECINYFGNLMNCKIYYGKTINEIAPIYCNDKWGELVLDCMHYNYNIYLESQNMN